VIARPVVERLSDNSSLQDALEDWLARIAAELDLIFRTRLPICSRSVARWRHGEDLTSRFK
jgi:hypothetical protein